MIIKCMGLCLNLTHFSVQFMNLMPYVILSDVKYPFQQDSSMKLQIDSICSDTVWQVIYN